MNEFNYTQWMQQNKVGPYGKTLNEENGDNKFTIYDIIPMIKINVDIKNISNIAFNTLADYAKDSYCMLKDNLQFINIVDDKIYSVFVGDHILTGTLNELGLS